MTVVELDAVGAAGRSVGAGSAGQMGDGVFFGGGG